MSLLCAGLVGPFSDERLEDASVGPGWAEGSRFKMEPCSRLESREPAAAFPAPDGSPSPGRAAWPAPRAALRPLPPASSLRGLEDCGASGSSGPGAGQLRAPGCGRLRGRTRPGAGAQQVSQAAVAGPAFLVYVGRGGSDPTSQPRVGPPDLRAPTQGYGVPGRGPPSERPSEKGKGVGRW